MLAFRQIFFCVCETVFFEGTTNPISHQNHVHFYLKKRYVNNTLSLVVWLSFRERQAIKKKFRLKICSGTVLVLRVLTVLLLYYEAVSE